MDPDSIRMAINCGDIPLLHEFINNEAILQKFVNDDPSVFYYILSSAIIVNRDHLNLDDVNKIYDDLILQLIRAAKEVHFGLFHGNTLLMVALKNRQSCDIIIKLLEAGSDVNVATNRESLLLTAVHAGNETKIIDELINRGADINCRNCDGWTPLFYGMHYRYDRPDLILLLLNAGSNVHNIDNDGKNVLMIRSCYCFGGRDCRVKESVDMLLKYGINDIDLKHTDNKGNTVLHETFCKYIFELAMKAGVSIEAKNNKGRTLLLRSVQTPYVKKVVYLLNSGVNLHSTDSTLDTALHISFKSLMNLCDPSVFYVLIYRGLNMYACNINNETPMETAVTKSYKELTYIIPQHIILFGDNQFDIGKKALEKLGDRNSLFLYECDKELNVMRKTFIKDGLTFYEFCILKRYYKSKCVNIAPNEYKYSFSDISKFFPIYKNIIIIRIEDNRRKKRELDFRRVFERIIFHPVKNTEVDYSEVLNYYCLYRISQFLNFKEMFNVFSVAIES